MRVVAGTSMGSGGGSAAGVHTLHIPSRDRAFSFVQVEKAHQHKAPVPKRPYHVLKSLQSRVVPYVQNAVWETEVRAARSSVWHVTGLMTESCWKWTKARERVDCASMKRQEIRQASHNYSKGAEDHEQLVRITRATRLAAKTVPEAVPRRKKVHGSQTRL